MARLTLNSAGIKSPLDFDAAPAPPDAPDEARASPPPKLATSDAPRRRRSARTLAVAQAPQSPPDRFYGAGRSVQTSLALDADRAAALAQLSRAGSVAVNPLAVAAIHAGLPSDTKAARSLIVAERVARAGDREARVERNLRLPEPLHARVDELVAAVRDQIPRATRSDLVNATLRAGLPSDAHAAADLVRTHAQRLERSQGET